jgi:hypothetical protein
VKGLVNSVKCSNLNKFVACFVLDYVELLNNSVQMNRA